MPQRDNELPEGTDHIINGAMETGDGIDSGGTGGAGGATGSGAAGSGGATTGGATGGGGSSSGFIGSTANDGTGGAAATGGDMTDTNGTGGTGGTGGSGGEAAGVVGQLRGQATNLRGQATERVRDFAESGKTRASDALDELSKVVSDTADSIDERLGQNYGEYARRTADAVSGFADTLRRKEVDELYDNVRSAVRKSPAVAVGIAAVVGFTLVRLVKAGLGDDRGGGGSGSGRGGAGA